MSQADIERFVATLKTDSGLQEEIKTKGGDLASVVEFAKSKGYDISVDEAKAYINEQAKQQLSDDQLDAVAGGKAAHHPELEGGANPVPVILILGITII